MMDALSARSDRFLANLSAINERLQRAQRQVTSGLRMQVVSDDPDNVSALLTVKSQIAHNDQLKYNLSRIKTEIDSAESAINNATILMDRARQFGAQGASSITDSSTRNQLANQVGDLITSIFGLASTQIEGRYIFSGNSDQTAPFSSIDPTQPNSVGAYNGGTGIRAVEHPNGSTFPVALNAQQIFDPAAGAPGSPEQSVFRALTSLKNALQANDTNAIVQATADIATSSTYLSQQQSKYGDMQNQLIDAMDYQTRLNTSLKTQQSNIQDADMPQAISDSQLQETSLVAALQIQANMPRKSLFDYLG